MKEDDIPYLITDVDAPKVPTFPICNLIDEIASEINISDSFDYVVSHLESSEQREHIKPKKEYYCKRLRELLSTGTFRISQTDFRTMRVNDGPKERIVQAPTVFHRVGCHAIMVPFERYTYPTLIKNTASSIKGRGMHWLHQIIEDDLMVDSEGMKYFYQCDILGFYDHINQEILKCQVREYTSDKKALAMMDNFITLLPTGISKGLRSSQCLANLHLNEIDHKMCECVGYHTISNDITKGDEKRYHYYRYCDDMVIFASSKKELWALRDTLKTQISQLGLTIKHNEAVRPSYIGLDYLGYVTYTDESNGKRIVYSQIRKRTKQKFARRIKCVKSRKRRQSLIGSFFGMAAHADCKHLLKRLIKPSEYKKLKHTRKMKDFGDFKIKPPTLDGKKNFKGRIVYPQELDHCGIIILDFEKDVIPKRERDEYNRRLQSASMQNLDSSLIEKPKSKYIVNLIHNGTLCKLWTGDREIWQILNQLEEEDAFPLFVGVTIDYTGKYKKLNFVPASSLNIKVPTDEELEIILERCNIKL